MATIDLASELDERQICWNFRVACRRDGLHGHGVLQLEGNTAERLLQSNKQLLAALHRRRDAELGRFARRALSRQRNHETTLITGQDRLRQSFHFSIQFNHIAHFKSPPQK
ncbi:MULTISPECIES: hypothetical protein [unclassified Bradyrhizobium]|uniref:hypothetical protein n=1 Tax=unclassified Bradyrhizobium TaxID=2631580 RepID=UPI0028EE35CC|nr:MULTISPECIES: hypothetical protein [unclassified Bradyrhizobium]